MPAFCVQPKMSPLGRSSSISAVSGSLPRGPSPAVSTCHSVRSDSTICSNPMSLLDATPILRPQGPVLPPPVHPFALDETVSSSRRCRRVASYSQSEVAPYEVPPGPFPPDDPSRGGEGHSWFV